MDDALFDVILGRIEDDATLSEGAIDLLLGACEGDDALADAIEVAEVADDDRPARPRRPRRRPAAERPAERVGAFLSSITVEGFRGVGRASTLDLHPGRGLTVVTGRNGSGKSSFAEALEVLLTGTTGRFHGYAAFKGGWRNLHQRHPTRITAELHVDGAPGRTVVERSWGAGADLDGSTVRVQVAGERATTGLEHLGWTEHLVAHKPFLAHTDLEAMFGGKPSDLYDRLAAVLGLGDLTAAQARLRDRRLALESVMKRADSDRSAVLAELDGLDDERAERCRAALGAREPDLAGLLDLVSGRTPAPGGDLDVLRQLANLATPEPAAIEAAESALVAAGRRLQEMAGTEAARAKGLADLLERAVWLHDTHPADTDCPVCGRAAALDDPWRARVIGEVGRLRSEAAAADQAHAAAGEAVQVATGLVQGPPPAVGRAGEVGVAAAALAALWAAWVEGVHAAPGGAGPVRGDTADGHAPDDLRRLAAHLSLAVDLEEAAEPVRRAAARELARRDDRWGPIAARVAAWAERGRAAAAAKPVVKDLTAAEKWLKGAHDDIRNERLRPIAERARATWRLLRHESNVDLGAIRLAGEATRRRLVLDATVDGSDGNALGVMSQGEVNALALSVFLPRATLPESPFRFLVIDDPVQAMDPAKVEGLARVLHEAAQTHQVVVFTHDDRLPATIRHLGLDARMVQVQRRPGSVVEISPAGDPVTLALGEARAFASVRGAPDEVKRRVVPGLCRLALEAALTEAAQRRELRAGRGHHEVEALLDGARTLNQKAALALFGDTDAGERVLPRLNGIGRPHADTFQALKKGGHGSLAGSPHDTVNATGRLIDALQAALP